MLMQLALLFPLYLRMVPSLWAFHVRLEMQLLAVHPPKGPTLLHEATHLTDLRSLRIND